MRAVTLKEGLDGLGIEFLVNGCHCSCWKTSPQRYHVMRLVGEISWQESDQSDNFDCTVEVVADSVNQGISTVTARTNASEPKLQRMLYYEDTMLRRRRRGIYRR